MNQIAKIVTKKLEYQTENPSVGQLAFWEYDLFPYTKCGIISELSGNDIIVGKYGNKRRLSFHGKHAYLNLEDGERVKAELDTLLLECRQAQANIEKEFRKRAKKIAPFLVDILPHIYKSK